VSRPNKTWSHRKTLVVGALWSMICIAAGLALVLFGVSEINAWVEDANLTRRIDQGQSR
jgi:hypothetical protein